jgi:hypothetical protein
VFVRRDLLVPGSVRLYRLLLSNRNVVRYDNATCCLCVILMVHCFIKRDVGYSTQ